MSPWTIGAILVAVSTAGCGGTVIIEGDEGAGAESGSPSTPWSPGDPGAPGDPGGPDDPGGPGGKDGWAPAPPGPCLSCAAWFGACGEDEVCPTPLAVCDAELAIADDLVACICSGCAPVCEGSCAFFNQNDADCLACQQQVAQDACQYERFACIGSPFP